MNNAELKQRLRDLSHRRDLEEHLQGFINSATVRINRRFGQTYSDMLNDADSNLMLSDHHDIYVYEAMRQLSLHIHDWAEAKEFDSLFVAETSRQDITTGSNWSTPTEYIRSEVEEAVENA